MNKHPFKFSPEARLYAKNLDLIDEILNSKAKNARQLYVKYKNDIREMRAEAYRNIVNFRDRLVEQLHSKVWQSKRIHSKRTHTAGSYFGGIADYFWYDAPSKKIGRRLPGVGMVAFVFPITPKVKRDKDAQWKEIWPIFDIITSDRLNVSVAYRGSNLQANDRIMGLMKNRELGDFDNQYSSNEFYMWLSLDRNDPVGSSTEKIVSLLRAIYLAQNLR